MHINNQKIGLYGVFVLMFFWDVVYYQFPNLIYIVLIGLLLVSTNFNFKRIKINKSFVIVMIYVITQGGLNIILGNDTIEALFKQVFAIFVCFVVYDNIIRPFSLAEIMTVYWKTAFCMALIGDIEAMLSLLNNPALTNLPIVFTYTTYGGVVGPFPRLASLCREPSFLGYFLAPALCMYLCKFISPELLDDSLKVVNNNFQGLLILMAYILTFSSVAYYGLAVMLLILWWNKGLSLKKVLIPILLVILYIVAYNNVDFFRDRITDTWNIFNGFSTSSHVNLSSFTYYANWNVALSAFKWTWGLGSGLGSYQYMFDKFSIGSWGASGLALNREDGNSAFFRLFTELGLLGIVLIGIFMIKFFRKDNDKYVVYSCSILTLFLMLLLRQGNYIHAGSILFVCLYIKVNKIPKLGYVRKNKNG